MAAPGPVRRAPSSKSDWETPPELWLPLHDEFGFTLDGAANDRNHKCPTWYGPGSSLSEDAFAMQPKGEVIWCNPPYGGLKDWIDLFVLWGQENTVVALLPDSTDTVWFRRIYKTAHEVRLLNGRVSFIGTTSGNTGGNLVAIWKPSARPPAAYLWLWDWKQ